MKITIEIPKEFEEHYKKDRFKDSLMRLACDIHCMAGQYERETVAMLIEAFRNAEEARKEATKMTNGDKIRAMTDEKLAKLLDATTQYCNLHCVARHLCNGTKTGKRETCAEMICKWLKQEAEE